MGVARRSSNLPGARSGVRRAPGFLGDSSISRSPTICYVDHGLPTGRYPSVQQTGENRGVLLDQVRNLRIQFVPLFVADKDP